MPRTSTVFSKRSIVTNWESRSSQIKEVDLKPNKRPHRTRCSRRIGQKTDPKMVMPRTNRALAGRKTHERGGTSVLSRMGASRYSGHERTHRLRCEEPTSVMTTNIFGCGEQSMMRPVDQSRRDGNRKKKKVGRGLSQSLVG